MRISEKDMNIQRLPILLKMIGEAMDLDAVQASIIIPFSIICENFSDWIDEQENQESISVKEAKEFIIKEMEEFTKFYRGRNE